MEFTLELLKMLLPHVTSHILVITIREYNFLASKRGVRVLREAELYLADALLLAVRDGQRILPVDLVRLGVRGMVVFSHIYLLFEIF